MDNVSSGGAVGEDESWLSLFRLRFSNAELAKEGLPFSYLSSAHHIVFDEKASAVVDSMFFDHKELIEELRPFAKPPHDAFIVDLGHSARKGGTVPILFFRRQDGRYSFVAIKVDGKTGNHHFVIGAWDWYSAQADDARDYLDACLLLLNQPRSGVSFSERPAVRERRGHKTLDFMRQSVVKLDLAFDVRHLRREPGEPTGRKLGWHRVAGHYWHRGGSRSCTHPWHIEELDSEGKVDGARCPSCNRLRRWRTYPNGRGSAEHGYISQRHHVTHSGVNPDEQNTRR